MPSTNHPMANRTTQWKPQFGGITMPRLTKICLHTTESAGWPGYPSFAPQLTVDVVNKQARQHMPLNVSASTLANPSSTPVSENRDEVLQIEIVGYCDPARKTSSKHISKWGDAEYKYLGQVVGWISKEWGVPLTSTVKWVAYPASYGTRASQRLTSSQYDAYKGILGHQHASGNDHGDPGNIDIAKLLKYAREAAGTVAPTPTPVPAPPKWDGTSYPGVSAFRLSERHDAVTVLGQRLVAHGWKGYEEGPGPVFSESDVKAVKWFQERLGVEADGVPGPWLWERLIAAPKPPEAPTKPVEPAPVPEPEKEPEKPPAPTQGYRKGQPVAGGKITTPYGTKGNWAAGYHPGDDWNFGSSDDGSEDYWFPVYATKPGVVDYVGTTGWAPEYGRQVRIKYADGRMGTFAHLAKIEVAKGDKVTEGELIGRLGWSGRVFPENQDGSHLHYEERVAPYRYGTDARRPVYAPKDSAPDPKPEPKVTETFLSFNLRRISEAGHRWPNDRGPKCIRLINDSDCSFVAATEAPPSFRADITAATKIKKWFAAGNVAAGYDPEVWDLLHDNVYELTTGADDRRVPLVVIKHKNTGKEFKVGVVHLTNLEGPDGGDAWRLGQIRELMQATTGIDLLGGDFNSPRAVYEQLEKYELTELRKRLPADKITNVAYNSSHGYGARTEKSGRWIDNWCTDKGVEVLSAANVLTDKASKYPWASDHNAISVVVAV